MLKHAPKLRRLGRISGQLRKMKVVWTKESPDTFSAKPFDPDVRKLLTEQLMKDFWAESVANESAMMARLLP